MAKLNTIENLAIDSKTDIGKVSTQSNILDNLTIVPNPNVREKGFYAPSFTTDQMLAFTPSSNAVIIFNRETQTFMTFSDCQWIPLVNSNDVDSVIIPISATAPVNPSEGLIYCDSTLDQLRIFFLGRWSTIGRVFL